MKEFNLVIKSNSGKFNKLDKLYRDFVINSLTNFDDDTITRWEVYNTIMSELVNIGSHETFQEIKYRVTDGENPNLIMLDIINRFCDDNDLIWLLKSQIKAFVIEDFKNDLI
jgi:hypothetical protein